VTLTSGDEFDATSAVTVLVGPNNSGKSAILRDIASIARSGNPPTQLQQHKSVARFEMEQSGIYQDLFERFGRSYGIYPPGDYPYGTALEPHFRYQKESITAERIGQIWLNRTGNFGWNNLTGLLLAHLETQGRLGFPFAGTRWDPYRDMASTPVQRLFDDRALEAEISKRTMRAFGAPLTVHRYNGNSITLHVGTVQAAETVEPASRAYLDEIGSLPLWQDQGDGMRAFLGILLSIATADHPIILIDEPEAFLHPPQAKLLGRLLVELHGTDTQLIIATHSADIIDGITAASRTSGNVSIVRVTRSPGGNKAVQVAPETVRPIFDDPLIRYCNVVDGLFSDGTVLCEADSDCTYYQAVLSDLEHKDDTGFRSFTPHFTHCNGKNRLPKAVEALHSANAPVACIVDFDFLCADADFEGLVTACGGDPDELKAWRNDVVSAVNQKTRKPDRLTVKALVGSLFDGTKGGEMTAAEIRKISTAIKAESGWKDVKVSGRGALSGQAVTSFDELNYALREIGIFLVPIGELERFHPEVRGDNKAHWLRVVLERELFRNASEARDLVDAVIKYLAKIQ